MKKNILKRIGNYFIDKFIKYIFRVAIKLYHDLKSPVD